jgi:putative nucleotidyltransferase with HDIG domain
MVTLEKVEQTIRDITAALQAGRLYSTQHALFKQAVYKAYQSLQVIFTERAEFVIGIVGKELVFEKDVFFELSKFAQPVIAYFKDRGIEKIVFYSAIELEELDRFVTFCVEAKRSDTLGVQQYLAVMGIRNIKVSRLQTANGSPSGEPELPDIAGRYDSCQEKFTQTVEDMLNDQALDYLALRLVVNNIMEGLTTRYRDLLKLTTIKRFDKGTFSHIINVSVLAMYFSSRMGFNREDVLDIGTAALFHDIGKLYVSRSIIRKDGKLTGDEFESIKSHTTLGVDILLKYVDTLGILPLVVAFEHHLRYDTSGYPKVIFPLQPHTASLIVSICDVYDALFQRRSYKSDYPPNVIYEFMLKEKGKLFEPALLTQFFTFMGVWPIGTIVELSDGRVAVVRKEHEEDIFSPQVEVLTPEDKRETIELKDTKDTLQIARSLNPYTEAKDYLSLV